MNILPIDNRRVNELQKQCLHHNVFPIDLSYCSFTKKPEPVYNLLQPLLDECIENLQVLHADELKILLDAMPPGIRSGIGQLEEPLLKRYYTRIAIQYLAMLVQRGYSPLRDVINITHDSSSVLEQCPELKNSFDGDGLLILNDEFIPLSGGIKYRGKILHYHQFLRRVYSSEPNFDFLERFAAHVLTGNNRYRIAIDHRRIMSESEYREIMEYDHWRGPQFDALKLDNLDQTSVTVMSRERPSPFDGNYVLDRTEFYWKIDRSESVKTLEIEEIASSGNTYEGWHINRYIHSERNTEISRFQHFDGAVKLYPSGSYEDRLSTNMPRHLKAAHYIKMFRIDGAIDFEEWLELLSYYFRGNEMIVEYFDPETFEKEYRPLIEQYKKN